MRTRTPAEKRKARDELALARLLRGEQPELVAARAGISRVQLWRRVGTRLATLRQTNLQAIPA